MFEVILSKHESLNHVDLLLSHGFGSLQLNNELAFLLIMVFTLALQFVIFLQTM